MTGYCRDVLPASTRIVAMHKFLVALFAVLAPSVAGQAGRWILFSHTMKPMESSAGSIVFGFCNRARHLQQRSGNYYLASGVPLLDIITH
jgi:hypothetical protein